MGEAPEKGAETVGIPSTLVRSAGICPGAVWLDKKGLGVEEPERITATEQKSAIMEDESCSVMPDVDATSH